MAKDLSQVLSAVIREYDIRGIVGEELTPKLSYCLGRAYADYARLKCHRIDDETTVAVGHDCRTASFSLAKALCHGLSDGGLHPLYLGMVTTPIVYYATCALNLAGGIAVTEAITRRNTTALRYVWEATPFMARNLKTWRACPAIRKGRSGTGA